MYNSKFIALFVSGLFLISFNAYNQQYFFDKYGVAEDLANSKVYKVLQDDQHIIWVGTESGVSLFDGKSFKNLSQRNGLSPNGVRDIIKDTKGRLWMGHNGGGVTLYENNTFSKIKLTNTPVEGDITSIVEDNNGDIWFTSNKSGVFRVSGDKSDSLKIKKYKGKTLSDRVFNSVVLKDGTLLFITDAGIKKYIEDSESFESFQLEGLSHFFQFIVIFEDSNSNLWFGTNNGGLYKYSSKTKGFSYFDEKNGLAKNIISAIYEDKNKNIWIGSWGGGISCINPNDEMQSFNSGNGFEGSKIHDFFEDIEGNILISTHENGMQIFKGLRFVSYKEKDGLLSDQVTAITEDKYGSFWFGSNSGISVLKNGKYEHFSSSTHNIGNDVRYIKQDYDKNLWIGTGSGVYTFLIDENKFYYDFTLNNRLLPFQKQVNAMLFDAQNNLWVGSLDGLIYFEPNNRKGYQMTIKDGLKSNNISALYLGRNNILWVGYQTKGISSIDQDLKIKHISAVGEITPLALCEDALGRLWIATESDGVLVYHNDTVVKRFREEDGLISNIVELIEADESNVYLGTHKGLNIYSLKEERFSSYTRKSGFTGIETKHNASFIGSKGNIWFGTVAGAMKYNKNESYVGLKEPFTHISKMYVNGEVYETQGVIKLRHNKNDIRFDFYSICVTDPLSVEYQYILEPNSQNWQNVNEKSKLFEGLNPGNYTFKVRARNNNGIWNEEPKSIEFSIRPPFYRTFWFITLCILAGISFVFSYIKIREKNLVKEKMILEDTVQKRTAELQEKKDQLEVYNKDITDSINYAQRIQFAMLPPGSPFDNTFILFRPKDIVSGDFYWFQQEDNFEFISAIDCTGHGVPGAFMSFIGYNTLDKIVKEYHEYKPSEILSKLNQEVIATLRQDHKPDDFDNVKDGMDMALICFDNKNMTIEFAGAYNPLILIRDGEIIETKADRVAIGHDKSTVYTNHSLKIEKGDAIYMFSDGYADQFGGPKRKKYKSAVFKRLLVSIQKYSMAEQKRILEETHDEWKGSYEQIDDILVIGRKF